MTLARLACLILLCTLAPTTAKAWIGPAVIGPDAASSLDTLYVDVTAGECDGHGEPTEANPAVEIEPGVVNVIVYGFEAFNDTQCFFPAITRRYTIGSLPVGIYALNVFWRKNANPLSDELISTTDLTIIAGAGAYPVPAAGSLAIALTVLLFLVVGIRRFRLMSGPILVILIAGTSSPARAEQRIDVLLREAPNAPSPEQIVDDYDFSSGSPPPLTGLGVENPEGAQYYLKFRARGEFKTLLESNPEWTRAKLERYITILYPDSATLRPRSPHWWPILQWHSCSGERPKSSRTHPIC